MLKQRSLSAVVVVLLVAVPAFVGGPVFAGAMLLLGLMSLREILGALSAGRIEPFRITAYVMTTAMIGAVALQAPPLVMAALITTTVLAMLAAGIARPSVTGSLSDWALTLGATLYIALPLAHSVALREIEGDAEQGWIRAVTSMLGSSGTSSGLAWLAVAIAVTWLTDTMAYLVGRRFGTAKLIPHLSPGKTRVGAAAGLVTGAVSGAVATELFGAPIPWMTGAGVGLLLAVLAQVGDLSESLIKRNLGVKDMGNLIPGHGGVLDRIDALLFTFPATYYVAILLQKGGGL